MGSEMTVSRRTMLQILSLALILTSGLSLGVDVHLWLVSYDDHADHDTPNCPICQQALSNPMLMLAGPCLEAVEHLPAWCLIPVPESRVVPAQRLEPTAPRGPPFPLSDLFLI